MEIHSTVCRAREVPVKLQEELEMVDQQLRELEAQNIQFEIDKFHKIAYTESKPLGCGSIKN
jgi:hypothetical protein